MINAIIFDFGDVFINLDYQKPVNEFKKLGLEKHNEEIMSRHDLFEKGKISETEFIDSIKKNLPNATSEEIISAWQSIIGDFPLYRLEFLQLLSTKYRLFLLSNTDSIHINYFEENVGISFYTDFYRCFEKVYFSYEMGLRKPEPEIFTTVINKHNLNPNRTLFVDDKNENTDAAAKLGLHIWNLQVGKEDVVDLFKLKYLPL